MIDVNKLIDEELAEADEWYVDDVDYCEVCETFTEFYQEDRAGQLVKYCRVCDSEIKE